MKKAILLISLIIVIILSTVLLSTKTPQKEGEDIIFQTKNKDFAMSDYYELLTKYYGNDYLYQRFEKDLLTSLERSDKIKETATAQVKELNDNIAQNAQPEENKENVVLTLKSLGYKGYEEIQLYFENYLLRTELIEKYIYENLDSLYDTYQATGAKPRYVSHILIKVADIENPTAEELAQLDTIKKRIQNGEDFAVLAKEFSVDGSKEAGGYLGLMDKNTQFVEPFLEAALNLEDKQLSEWVKSDFGYHLIKVDTADKEKIIKEAVLNSMIYQALPEVDAEVMKKLISDTNIVFHDKDFEHLIEATLNTKGFQ